MENKKGKLFIVLGPSGVGKGTLLKGFLANNTNVLYSISTTTRAPRVGEEDGVHYFFESVENFKKMIENDEFLEWAEFSGNFYGTNKKFVEKRLNQGFDILLEIEVQGAKKVLQTVKDAVSIFILPPSREELEKRLRGRKTETEDAIEKRLKRAIAELDEASDYKYQVVNNNIDEAISKLQEIYEAEKNA